jgi:hypothetical protein
MSLLDGLRMSSGALRGNSSAADVAWSWVMAWYVRCRTLQTQFAPRARTAI